MDTNPKKPKETQLQLQERKKREFIEFLRRERLNEKLKLREELFKKSKPVKHTPLLSLPASTSLSTNLKETIESAKSLTEDLLKIKGECSKYSEHKNKDGKTYYFCKRTQSSTWDKPTCFSIKEEIDTKLNQLKSIESPKEENKQEQPNVEENNISTKTDEEFVISLDRPLAFIWNRDMSMVGLTSLAPYGIIPLPNMINIWAATLIDEIEYYYTGETKQQIKDIILKIIKLRGECSLYQEYATKKGKQYYFNFKTTQSVWEKPKCLVELDDFELQLEFLKTQKVDMPYETTKEENMNSRPIFSELVPFTEWHVVWTSDKRVFFHKQNENLSVWERPEILKSRVDVDELVKKTPSIDIVQNDVFNFEKEKNFQRKNLTLKVKKYVDDVSVEVHDMSEEKGKSEIPAKIARLNKQKATDDFLSKNKIDASKEAAIKAEKEATIIRDHLSLEERVSIFKEMLFEKEVALDSKWHIELRKVVFDPRYLLLNSNERKMLYEKFVEDHNFEKISAEQKKKNDFNDLLQEANVNLKSRIDFLQFALCWGKDERFQAIDGKEREPIFNEYLANMRKETLSSFFKKYL